MTKSARVLYITYDGLTDPLGRSQVLPYLKGLSERGHRITVLSCEKPERMDRDGVAMRKLCDEAGLGWHPMRYHKWPPVLSSTLDAAALKRAAVALHKREGFDLVHCRSYIPAGVGLGLKRRFGTGFLFDMRGFWPDEKVEGGNWSRSNPVYAAVYRYFKRLESGLLSGADHIVSLTKAGKAQLLTRPELHDRSTPISVIPCCVDFSHFPIADAKSRTAARSSLQIPAGVEVLAYLGSLGSWYMLDEMLEFFKVYAAGRPGARFLFVTADDPQAIREAAGARGVDAHRLIIVAGSRDEMPRLLAAADLGIFFIKPVFSKIASSPTKMGEMLAIGLPIVANAGVGDVEDMIEQMECGVAVHEFNEASYREALDRIGRLPGTAQSRRDAALPLFNVQLGIDRFDSIYRELIDQSGEKPIEARASSKRRRNSSRE